MNCLKITGRIGVCLTTAALLSACNDVAFSPADAGLAGQVGESGKTVNEDFTQGVTGNKLDILFVVDNSLSMAEDQKKMGEKINSFLGTLNDVDWQIGITTTDVSNGNFGLKGGLLTFEGTNSYVLTRDTPNYEAAFKNTIIRKESIGCGFDCASGLEQPLNAAMLAIGKRNSSNKNFFRSGADLGVLVLSDADEMSNGGTDPNDAVNSPSNPPATTPEELISTFNSAWQGLKNIYAFGMIIEPNDTACLNAQRSEALGEGYYGNFVSALARMTDGLTGSICDSDFGPTLGKLAEKARRLLDYVQIKYIPVPEHIKITFAPTFTTTWSVRGRNVYFNPPPPKGTKISIEYLVK